MHPAVATITGDTALLAKLLDDDAHELILPSGRVALRPVRRSHTAGWVRILPGS